MFAERLKELREKCDLSQLELAKVLGVTPQAISNYETGKREPEISEMVKLADYFGVSIDYLVGRTSYVIEQDMKVYYAIVERIKVPKSFTDKQIDTIICNLANGKNYTWSKHKGELKNK